MSGNQLQKYLNITNKPIQLLYTDMIQKGMNDAKHGDKNAYGV